MNTAMSNDEKQKARDKSVLHGGQTVEEFLETNKNWKIKERFYNNNGLTILEKV